MHGTRSTSWITVFVPSSGLVGCRSRAYTEAFLGNIMDLTVYGAVFLDFLLWSMLTTLKELSAVNAALSIRTSTFVPYLGLRVCGIRNQCLEPVHVDLLDGR